jgi:hypothetical protein
MASQPRKQYSSGIQVIYENGQNRKVLHIFAKHCCQTAPENEVSY